MKTRRVLPYIVFAVSFLAFALVLELAIEELLHDRWPIISQLIAYVIATPLGIVLAHRFGELDYIGMLITAVILYLATCWAIIAILDQVSKPAGGSFGLSNYISSLGWSQLLSQTTVSILIPILSLFVLRRFARTAPAAA